MLSHFLRFHGFFLAAALLFVTQGCSVRKFVVNQAADALSGSAGVFASDEDLELIRDALPFTLKTFEAMLEVSPENEKLLLGSCQGFTQYSFAFIDLDLLQLEIDDYKRYKEQKTRARKMYLRARDYCLRAFEGRAPGIVERLRRSPEEATFELGKDDVELMFWTGTAWGAAISIGVDQPDLVADLSVVRALIHRALDLDPSFGDGLLHEAMVVLESLPEAMGGSVDRAREHYNQALELNRGLRASTHVTWAELISYGQQNRQEFEERLQQALAVDPDAKKEERLATLIAQKKARILLSLTDDLFLE